MSNTPSQVTVPMPAAANGKLDTVKTGSYADTNGDGFASDHHISVVQLELRVSRGSHL